MYYVIATVAIIALELLYFFLAKKFHIVDRPNERSSHHKVVLLGAGIIFYLAMLFYSLTNGIPYPNFLIGLSALAIISYIDDLRQLPSWFRLFAQLFAVLFSFWFDINALEIWQIMLLVIVFAGILNIYNFMDGINGITSGYSLAVLAPLIVLNRSLHFIDMSYLIVVGIACLIFCFFNFRPKGKAKCFAGDVGSIGIAFMILLPLGKLILQTGDVTYIILLAVYGVDTILTICHRILLHEHLGQAHRKHAFQIMANELRLPHEVVSLSYMVIQTIISFGLLYISRYHWIYAVCAIGVLCIAYLLFMKKYYHLHAQYLHSLEK